MIKRSFTIFLAIIAAIMLSISSPRSILAARQARPSSPLRAENTHPAAAREQNLPVSAASWQYGPDAPFQLWRFDGEYVPGTASETWARKIYFLGGRISNTVESPDIWYFDPLTGVYADTGVDMVEDVSNYTANLVLEDIADRGPALYVIGGTNADAPGGKQAIGTVQRFFPKVGLAEALPADDFPGMVAGVRIAGMGTAVVDGRIYVFGGFETDVAPYYDDRTWVFDPLAAAGSRWTQGPDLSVPRAHIQVAVQDSKIYAMGGDATYDGNDIEPTSVVEMLDTSNPVAWSTVGNMPVASGEGQGVTFKTGGLEMGLAYVIGGGNWTDSSPESMVFRPFNNAWDQGFPDLLVSRRNHAAAFVPICTPDPNDGLPGIWVFGGRTTDDPPSAPTGPTEFYSLPCPTNWCDVLLVDDDWDRTSTHGGGRPYYTTALDANLINYEVWETKTQGSPSAADMYPYNVVLWFTGYALEEGVITPNDELSLTYYLANGGNLILSSEDYLHESGLTPFGDVVLGLDTFTEDVEQISISGAPANPLTNGMGPYPLVRPDQWDVYWPTAELEGPFDDVLHADAGILAEPFIYTATGDPNTVAVSNALYKSLFMGFPLEWIPGLDDRAQILNAALVWMCGPRHIFLPLINR